MVFAVVACLCALAAVMAVLAAFIPRWFLIHDGNSRQMLYAEGLLYSQRISDGVRGWCECPRRRCTCAPHCATKPCKRGVAILSVAVDDLGSNASGCSKESRGFAGFTLLVAGAGLAVLCGYINWTIPFWTRLTCMLHAACSKSSLQLGFPFEPCSVYRCVQLCC